MNTARSLEAAAPASPTAALACAAPIAINFSCAVRLLIGVHAIKGVAVEADFVGRQRAGDDRVPVTVEFRQLLGQDDRSRCAYCRA